VPFCSFICQVATNRRQQSVVFAVFESSYKKKWIASGLLYYASTVTQKIFLTLIYLRKLRNFWNKLKRTTKTLPIYNFPGSVKFLSNSKNKPNLQERNATKPFKLALYFQPRRFYPQSIKIMCPPLIKVWSYINICVAVTVGT